MNEEQEHIHELELEIERDTSYIRWGIVAAFIITGLCFAYFVFSKKTGSDDTEAVKKSNIEAQINAVDVYLDRPDRLIINVAYTISSDLTKGDNLRLLALPRKEDCPVRQSMNSLKPEDKEVKLTISYLPSKDGEASCISQNIEVVMTHSKDNVFQGNIASKTISLSKSWAK